MLQWKQQRIIFDSDSKTDAIISRRFCDCMLGLVVCRVRLTLIHAVILIQKGCLLEIFLAYRYLLVLAE